MSATAAPAISEQLLAISAQAGGIELDYENVRAADREAFSKLVSTLADRLHPPRGIHTTTHEARIPASKTELPRQVEVHARRVVGIRNALLSKIAFGIGKRHRRLPQLPGDGQLPEAIVGGDSRGPLLGRFQPLGIRQPSSI